MWRSICGWSEVFCSSIEYLCTIWDKKQKKIFWIHCGSYLGVLVQKYFMNSSHFNAYELQACGSRNTYDTLTWNVIIFCLCSMASAFEHFLLFIVAENLPLSFLCIVAHSVIHFWNAMEIFLLRQRAQKLRFWQQCDVTWQCVTKCHPL